MKATVNGEARQVEEGTTLRALVEALGLHPGAVAVAEDFPQAAHLAAGLLRT